MLRRGSAPAILAFACACVFIGQSAPARAADRDVRSFVLLEIRGPGGEAFARQVEADLAELYRRVPASVYRRTAAVLGTTGASPPEVRSVASTINADAIIAGAVVAEGTSQARVLVVVRSGRTGEITAKLRFSMAGLTLPRLRERVTSGIVRAFEGHPPPPDPLGPPAVARETTPTVTPPTEPPPESENAETAVVTLAPSDPNARWAARGVTVGVGPAILGRSLSFDSGAVQGFSAPAVAGIRVDAAVFPFALTPEWAARHPILSTLGVAGGYAHVFSVGVTGGSPAIVTTAHGSRWYAQLLTRIPLGKRGRGGTLTVDATFQELTWAFDTTGIVLPDSSLDLMGAALGYGHTLGTPRVALAVRVGAYGLISAGQLTDVAFYGRATGWAVDAEANLTVRPTPWLWLRLAGRYTPTVLSFSGGGARLAKSALDQWADGVLEVGVAL